MRFQLANVRRADTGLEDRATAYAALTVYS
jgi:hypothetical protein